MRSTPLRALGGALALALLLTACGGGESSSTSNRQAGSTITVGLDGEPTSGINPFAATLYSSFLVITQVYDSILSRDDEGLPAPGVASEWEEVDDTTLVLTLRDDLTFHDGSAITAEDVVFSIDSYRNEESTSIFKPGYADVESVEVTGEDEVTITTSAPSPGLLNYLSTPYSGAVVSEAWVEENGADALDRQANGSGPFSLGTWRTGQSITFERFDEYREEGVPKVDQVVFRYVPDEAARLAALRSGDVDVAWLPGDGRSAGQAESAGFETEPGQALSNLFLFMNTVDGGALEDVRVRRAVSLGIDRPALNDLILGGGGSLAASIPPGDPYGEEPDPAELPYYERDVEAAQALLAEAGQEGVTLQVVVASDPQYAHVVATAEAMQEQLSEVGITLDLQLTPFADLVERYYVGDYRDITMSLGVGVPDPSQYMSIQFGGEGNRVDDPELDARMEAAAREADLDARAEAYREIEQYVADQALLVIPFAIPQGYLAWDGALEGFGTDPLGQLTKLWTAE